MEDDWLDQLSEDLRGLSQPKIEEDTRARGEVMRTLAPLFLKIWMRFVIDLGTRLTLSPPDSELGLYEGKNNWRLSELFNFSALAELSLADRRTKHHALRAESYSYQGREHIRLIFSLEEERVLDRVVMVNYLIYDSLAKDFSLEEAVTRLKPSLAKWYLALAEGELSILWNFCKEDYECVGV